MQNLIYVTHNNVCIKNLVIYTIGTHPSDDTSSRIDYPSPDDLLLTLYVVLTQEYYIRYTVCKHALPYPVHKYDSNSFFFNFVFPPLSLSLRYAKKQPILQRRRCIAV
jgi:hypothetical protein